MPTFQSLAELFPVILAPGVVALARGRWPRVHKAVDGLIVWLAVIGAGVLWALVIGAAFGEPFGHEMVRRGFLLGLLAACGHTLAKYRPKEAEPESAPSAPDTIAAPPQLTPENTGARPPKMDLEFDGQ